MKVVNGIVSPYAPRYNGVEGGKGPAAAVVQTLPNSTKCGGITESLRIAWMAYDHNVLYVPHGWNTAIGLAADLALVASIPVARYVEYLTPSPYIEEIITEPFKVDTEGYLPIADKPGLGIELNREALKKYGF